MAHIISITEIRFYRPADILPDGAEVLRDQQAVDARTLHSKYYPSADAVSRMPESVQDWHAKYGYTPERTMAVEITIYEQQTDT